MGGSSLGSSSCSSLASSALASLAGPFGRRRRDLPKLEAAVTAARWRTIPHKRSLPTLTDRAQRDQEVSDVCKNHRIPPAWRPRSAAANRCHARRRPPRRLPADRKRAPDPAANPNVPLARRAVHRQARVRLAIGRRVRNRRTGTKTSGRTEATAGACPRTGRTAVDPQGSLNSASGGRAICSSAILTRLPRIDARSIDRSLLIKM